jgi:hypothetical protein
MITKFHYILYLKKWLQVGFRTFYRVTESSPFNRSPWISRCVTAHVCHAAHVMSYMNTSFLAEKNDLILLCRQLLRPVYTIECPMGYTMVLGKSHGKTAIYTRSPTDFLWDLPSTMGYPTV